MWNEGQERSCQTLKRELTNAPVLALYNRSAETELHTDSFQEGLGGVLLQRCDDGELHLDHCVSRRTSEAERRYYSTRLELTAVVWSIEKLRAFLVGIHFTIYTDVYMNAMKSKLPQISRWMDFIQDYDFAI